MFEIFAPTERDANEIIQGLLSSHVSEGEDVSSWLEKQDFEFVEASRSYLTGDSCVIWYDDDTSDDLLLSIVNDGEYVIDWFDHDENRRIVQVTFDNFDDASFAYDAMSQAYED